MVQADYFEENSLAVGDVLCIDNGTKNFTEDCLFVKITDTKRTETFTTFRQPIAKRKMFMTMLMFILSSLQKTSSLRSRSTPRR